MQLQIYQSDHDSGISLYGIGDKSVVLVFKNNDEYYTYTEESAGAEAIAVMKILARQGKGLSTYISQNVKNKYASKSKHLLE